MSAKRLASILPLAAFACGLQTSAMAGVVISGDYYEQTTPSKTCPSIPTCRLEFEPIPSDKILDIQRINCFIRANQPVTAIYMAAAPGTALFASRHMFYPFQVNTIVGSTHYYAINQETDFRLGMNRHVFFAFETDTNMTGSIQCGVKGRLSPR